MLSFLFKLYLSMYTRTYLYSKFSTFALVQQGYNCQKMQTLVMNALCRNALIKIAFKTPPGGRNALLIVLLASHLSMLS